MPCRVDGMVWGRYATQQLQTPDDRFATRSRCGCSSPQAGHAACCQPQGRGREHTSVLLPARANAGDLGQANTTGRNRGALRLGPHRYMTQWTVESEIFNFYILWGSARRRNRVGVSLHLGPPCSITHTHTHTHAQTHTTELTVSISRARSLSVVANRRLTCPFHPHTRLATHVAAPPILLLTTGG